MFGRLILVAISIMLACICFALVLDYENNTYKHEQKVIASCMAKPLCIHTVRHLTPEMVDCIQNTRCYQYLKENLK